MERVLSTVGLVREPDAKYVVSYGGGVNSTAMILFLVENKFPLDYVVFSDTGDEMPGTYKYLEVMTKYLKEKDIPFEIVKSKSGKSLSQKCLERRVIPSQIWRWCTRDFKVTPIHAFYRRFKCHVYQYMGIDYGEVRRMKPAKVDYVTNLYPLIDFKIDRDGCTDLIQKAGLSIPVKSGCFLCKFNSMDRWYEIYQENPDLFEQAKIIEENNKHYGKQNLGPDGLTLREMERPFKSGKYVPQKDSKKDDDPCGGECMV